jgi:hypothetical protein
MRLSTHKSLLWLVIVPLFLSGCGYDHGVDPIRTRIAGNIIFFGPPPEHVREARVVVAKKLPPDNILTDVIFSDPLTFKRDKSPTEKDTVHYELVAQPGVYPIAGILWRHKERSWEISNLLGVYFKFSSNFTIETQIVITDSTPIAQGIDIGANWALAKRDARITGKIKFKDKNQWRTDTDLFVLGCYSDIPKEPNEFFTKFLEGKAFFQLISQRTPVDSLRYQVEVNSELGGEADKGKYKFLALFWKGKTSTLAEIKAIGFYRCANEPLLPQAVLAPQEAVDFEADFATLPVGVIYRKDGTPCPVTP